MLCFLCGEGFLFDGMVGYPLLFFGGVMDRDVEMGERKFALYRLFIAV